MTESLTFGRFCTDLMADGSRVPTLGSSLLGSWLGLFVKVMSIG